MGSGALMEMRANTDMRAFARQLGVARKQMPFVLAMTLTRVAQRAREDLQASLPRTFTMRGTWVPRSIRFRPARKGKHPESAVGSLYAPMADHVEGGKRHKRGDSVAIPVYARRSPKQKTTRGRWPVNLLKRAKFFAKDIGDGKTGVFQRIKAGRQIRLWWVIQRDAQIKKAWPWEDIAARANDDRILSAFEEAWAFAQRKK